MRSRVTRREAARRKPEEGAQTGRQESAMTRQSISLSSLPWRLTGYHPYEWRPEFAHDPPERGADTVSIPAPVPGSVQLALRDAGLLLHQRGSGEQRAPQEGRRDDGDRVRPGQQRDRDAVKPHDREGPGLEETRRSRDF